MPHDLVECLMELAVGSTCRGEKQHLIITSVVVYQLAILVD